MESDLGKLFIGGISWDTNEDRLRGYFKNFGEVVEAVIMKDRTTGRARGFGFVVFTDPAVAEIVVMEKHLIDGRMVEAKKAVPRDDQHALNRISGSLSVSPCPGRTKKIFVGGLSSTVTELDFKKYFEQFGTITDVVVMHDHNTQRPRGFGFITFDSEEAIEKVLQKTFHQLNGKTVEVKRAVPKELSPGCNMRIPMGSYNHGLNRANNLLNGYTHHPYNQGSTDGYAMRMDGRFRQLIGDRKGLPSFGPGHGIGMNFESAVSSSYGGNSNFSTSFGYGRHASPYYNSNSSRFSNPASSFGSAARNIWSSSDHNYNASLTNSNSYMALASGNLNLMGSSSSLANYGVDNGSGFTAGNLGYGHGDNSLGFVAGGYGRNSGTGPVNSSISAINNDFEGNFTNLYGGRLNYGDLAWQSTSSEFDGSNPFAFGIGSAASNQIKSSTDYLGGYKLL